MSKLLSLENVKQHLNKLPNWKINEKGEICRTAETKSFSHALLLANAVGIFAESLNHHPDIFIQFSRVTFTLMTHDAGGLTEKDFQLASQIDSIPF